MLSFFVLNPTLPAAEAITTIAKYVNHYIRAGTVPLQGRTMKPLAEMCKRCYQKVCLYEAASGMESRNWQIGQLLLESLAQMNFRESNN